jgi:hypothetical protein
MGSEERDAQVQVDTSTPRQVSVSLVVPADAQRCFDVVADPAMHPVIDGSGTVRSARGGSRKLGPGDRFTTGMRIGLPYLISNKVVEYEEGRRIAWAHVGGWRWRYTFEPLDDADGPRTRVTETFDWSTTPARLYVEKAGWPGRHVANMRRTLERLEAFLARTSPSA